MRTSRSVSQFGGGVVKVAVQDHLDGSAARQHYVLILREQHRGQSAEGANPGAHDGVAGGSTDDDAAHGSDANIASGLVTGLSAIASDLSLGGVHFAFGGVGGGQAGAEIAADAIGQGKRIEADVEFALVGAAAGLFRLGDGALHVAAAGDDDVSV